MTSLAYSSGVPVRADDRIDPGLKKVDPASKSMERLNLLKAKSQAAWYAEVVKLASRLHEVPVEETESGKARGRGGAIAPFRLFL